MAGIVFWWRGINQDIEIAKKFLETRMLPFKYKVKQKDGTWKEESNFVQGALRPIQLYEYVVPKENVDAVLTSMFHVNSGKNYTKLKTMLRKAMGLKRVNLKKRDRTKKLLLPELLFRNINLQLVGVKEDKEGALDNDEGNAIGERL